MPFWELMQEQLDAAVALVVPERELTIRPMFGGACGYADGRIFASLSNIGLALKLPPAAQEELLREPDAKRLRYAPDAPESKHSIVVPPAVAADAAALAPWVKQSVEYVMSLPAPKPRKSKTIKE